MPSQIHYALRFARTTQPTLRHIYGRGWPLAIGRALLRARRIVRSTQWATRRDAEARHVRALALLPALYLDLRSRDGQKARDWMRELVTAFTAAEQERGAREAGLFDISDARERWHAFFDRGMTRGIGAFNENECLSIEAQRFHLRVVRCILAELGGEAGVPDLAPMVCEAELAFLRHLLPDYGLTRGVSARATIAQGHTCCDYVWAADPGDPAGRECEDAHNGERSQSVPGVAARPGPGGGAVDR